MLLVLVSYIFIGLSTYLVFKKILQLEKENYLILIIAMGSGPILLSWLLEKIMFFIPSHDNAFYITLIVFLFFIPYILMYSNIICVLASVKSVWNKNKKVWLTLALLFVISLLFVFMLPLTGNDPLQYVSVAEIVYEYKSFDKYPLIDITLERGYLPWTHPSSYVGLIVWSFLLEGDTSNIHGMQLVSVIYFFYTVWVFYYLLHKKFNDVIASLSVILFFATPLYVYLVVISHIDILRIFSFFTTVVFMSTIRDRFNYRTTLLLGILVGLSLHTHSLSILTLVYSLFFIMFLMNFVWTKKIRMMVSLLGVSFIFVLFRYVENYVKFGYVLGDQNMVWKLQELNYDFYVKISRDLLEPSNRVFNGILKGFTHVVELGFIHWILLGYTFYVVYQLIIQKKSVLQTYIRFWNDDFLLQMSVLIIVLWYMATVMFTFLGIDAFIKNSRYFLTIYPFVIYVVCVKIGYFSKMLSK